MLKNIAPCCGFPFYSPGKLGTIERRGINLRNVKIQTLKDERKVMISFRFAIFYSNNSWMHFELCFFEV